MRHRVDAVNATAGIVVGRVVDIHRVVLARPVHVVLDGGHTVGIGVDERVQGRILLGTWTATRVGEAFKEQYTLVLCADFQLKKHH